MERSVERDAGWRTWPNAVTVVRLAIIPYYVWLLVTTGHRAAASWILAALGATDWVDGFLARRLQQTSTVGKILDPVADRVLVMTAVLSVAWAHAVPWWFALATLSREIVVSVLTVSLAAAGAARIDVLWWGKNSTFALMTAYPVFLLASNGTSALEDWQGNLRAVNWVVALFGLVVSWLVLWGYVRPARNALTAGRAGRQTN
jgi:cardiolipin synthase (CMP-forming)